MEYAVGFDRNRGFYPIVPTVIASYYDLFAIMGGSNRALLSELVVTLPLTCLSALDERMTPTQNRPEVNHAR